MKPRGILPVGGLGAKFLTSETNQDHSPPACCQVSADLTARWHIYHPGFIVNTAWLVCPVMAFNLTQAAGTITGTALADGIATIIRRMVITVAARLARSARWLILHLLEQRQSKTQWTRLFDHSRPPSTTAPVRPPESNSFGARQTRTRGMTRRICDPEITSASNFWAHLLWNTTHHRKSIGGSRLSVRAGIR